MDEECAVVGDVFVIVGEGTSCDDGGVQIDQSGVSN